MQSDQVFKEVLTAYLPPFVALFFPEDAARLDFSTLTFVDKEVFTDLHQGQRREADLVVQVLTWTGEAEMILIHIEIQAQPDPDFGRRMFEYFVLLWLRHRLPIYPIALLLHGGAGGVTEQVYEVAVFDRAVMTYRYHAISLPELSAEEYLQKDDPPAVGLSAFMAGNRRRRVRRKAESLKRILELEPREAFRFLLVNLVETGLPLRPSEEREFRRITEAANYREVKDMRLIYEERGLQKGLLQGLLQGKREDLIRLLEIRFGFLPEELKRRIETEESIKIIDEWMVPGVQAVSLADFESRIMS